MNKMFDDFVKSKIEVMEGIDFKANQERIRKMEEIKRNNEKRENFERIMFVSTFIVSIVLLFTLLIHVSLTTKTAMEDCTENHSLSYCQNHIL